MENIFAFVEDDFLAFWEDKSAFARGSHHDSRYKCQKRDGDDDVDSGIEQGGLGGFESGAPKTDGNLSFVSADGREESGSTRREDLHIAGGEGNGS